MWKRRTSGTSGTSSHRYTGIALRLGLGLGLGLGLEVSAFLLATTSEDPSDATT